MSNMANGIDFELEQIITGLEDKLSQGKELLWQLSAAKDEAQRQLKLAQVELERKQLSYQDLLAKHTEAVRELTEAQQQESELNAMLADEAYQSKQEQADKLAHQAAKLAAAEEDFARCQQENDAAAKTVDEALRAYSLQRVALSDLMQQQAEKQQLLQENFRNANREMTEKINAAISRTSLAAIRKTAAETATRLAQTSFDELSRALEKTNHDLSESQSKQEELQQRQEQEQQELKRELAELTQDAHKREDAAAAESKTKREAMEMAQSLNALSQNTFLAAEEKAGRLAGKLKERYSSVEQEASDISQQMEKALYHAMSERETYVKLLDMSRRIEDQAQQAINEENELRERILQLRMEYQDMKNAALVASNLATDATAARINADKSMMRTLSEMEQALITSAVEARQRAAAKETELREAESASANAFTYTTKKREAANEAKAMLEEAERNCAKAEQAMLDMSSVVEQRVGNNDSNATLSAARAAYDEAMQEATTLKEAAYTTNNNLRLAKNELELAERAYLDTVRNTSQQLIDCETRQVEMDERHQAERTEISTQLNIIQLSLEKISTMHRQKQDNLDKCKKSLTLEKEGLAAAEAELSACQQTTEATLTQLQHELEAVIDEDADQLASTQRETAALAKDYDDKLLVSIAAAQRLLHAKDQLLQAEQQNKHLTGELQAQRAALEATHAQLQTETAEKTRNAEQAVEDYRNPLALAKLDTQQATRSLGRRRAALDLANSKHDNCRDEVEHTEKTHLQMIADERQRRREEQEAMELAARRAEQKRLQDEEERRRFEAAEAARIAQEKADARERAIREQERLAKEKAERELAEEAAAIEMAAGQALLPSDDLTQLSTETIDHRLAAIKERAGQEADRANLRWTTLEQLEEAQIEAEYFAGEAQQNRKLFAASQDTTCSLAKQAATLRAERRALGSVWAGKIAQLERARQEKPALDDAFAKTQQVMEKADLHARGLLEQALENVRWAIKNNDDNIISYQHELDDVQQQVYQLDSQLSEAKASYAAALELLKEVASKWIYFETKAAKAAAQAEVIAKEKADQAGIRKQAEERINAARSAAAATADTYRRIGSVTKNTSPQQRRNRGR